MHSHNYRVAQPFTNQVQALYKIHVDYICVRCGCTFGLYTYIRGKDFV
jgi:hypothetical protein